MSFQKHKARKAAPISIRLGLQPDTDLHCETMDTGLVHRAVCLFTPPASFHWYSLRYPQTDG